MATLYYDSKSGRLQGNLVWEFKVNPDWGRSAKLGWAYGQYMGEMESKDERHCPIDPEHVTSNQWTWAAIDLVSGSLVPHFLALTNHDIPVCSYEMSEKISDSGLKGYSFSEGMTVTAEGDSVNLNVKIFRISGSGGFVGRWRVEGAPNLCPYCKVEPILCQGCGWRTGYDCPNCKKRVFHGAGSMWQPDGRSLLLKERPKTKVVEAVDWDGSDLFRVLGGGGEWWFANRRARQWFADEDIFGVEFYPALLNLDGVRDRLPDGSKST